MEEPHWVSKLGDADSGTLDSSHVIPDDSVEMVTDLAYHLSVALVSYCPV